MPLSCADDARASKRSADSPLSLPFVVSVIQYMQGESLDIKGFCCWTQWDGQFIPTLKLSRPAIHYPLIGQLTAIENPSVAEK